MRVDAARNRDAILAAARALIATGGGDVAMEQIAARSGVAVGTVYRHFPSKVELIDAVVDDSAARVADAAESAIDAVESGSDALAEFEWMVRFVADRVADDQSIKRAAADLGRGDRGPQLHRATRAIARLLGLAQRAGRVRADITIEDLALLLSGSPGPEVSKRRRDRWTEVIVAGLRADRSGHESG